jgi:hypothetical protein
VSRRVGRCNEASEVDDRHLEDTPRPAQDSYDEVVHLGAGSQQEAAVDSPAGDLDQDPSFGYEAQGACA